MWLVVAFLYADVWAEKNEKSPGISCRGVLVARNFEIPSSSYMYYVVVINRNDETIIFEFFCAFHFISV